MSYIDELNQRIIDIFESTEDRNDLFREVDALLKAEIVESFKNGLALGEKRAQKKKSKK